MDEPFFIRNDTPTIMDGLVIRWKIGGDVYTGEINASRNGVSIRGTWPVMSAETIAVVEEQLTCARIAHEEIRQTGQCPPDSILFETAIQRDTIRRAILRDAHEERYDG